MKKTYEEFLHDLGISESSGRYDIINKYGYAGKYQMGEEAMVAAGYYKPKKSYNNKWDGEFTGKDGVYTIQDFLHNKQAQDNAIREFQRSHWQEYKNRKDDVYIGKVTKNQQITPSGMLASSHLRGTSSVDLYLRNNGNISDRVRCDANKTCIEDYMRKFSNYDVSTITHPNPQSKLGQSIHQQSVNKQINQNSNYNTLNNLLNPVSKLKQNSIIQIKSKPTGFAAPIEQATTPQVSYTPEQIGKMSREEFDKNESSIMHQLQTGGFNQKPSRDFGGYRNSHTGDNRIYTAEDIGNFSSSEFSHHEPAISAQMNSIGIPTNNDMQNSGGTVYIAPYTRSDGVQVRGHYRSR